MIKFVVVTFRQNKKVLDDLLGKIPKDQVIIVDNNASNPGFGAGANIGITKALSEKADWVVILNQDLTFTGKSVRILTRYLNKQAPSIAGPFTGYFDPKRYTTIYPSSQTGYISGSLMAIHKDVIKINGLFYEPYFMYYEDAEYCYRASEKNIPLIRIVTDGIKHKDSSTLGKNTFLHQYYLARNHLLFVLRNAPLNVKIHELVRLPKTLFEHFINKEYGSLQGIGDFITGKFEEFKH